EAAEPGRLPPAVRVEPRDLAFEFMLNALRLPAGFEEATITARTGLPFAAVAGAGARAHGLGPMARPAAGRWRPAARGLRPRNDLQAVFPPAAEGRRAGAV